jgi:hypothetical protein
MASNPVGLLRGMNLLPAAKRYWAVQRVKKASDEHYADGSEEIYPIFAMEDDAIAHGFVLAVLFSRAHSDWSGIGSAR